VIIIMLWVYYSAILLLFGAQYTQVVTQRNEGSVRPAPACPTCWPGPWKKGKVEQADWHGDRGPFEKRIMRTLLRPLIAGLFLAFVAPADASTDFPRAKEPYHVMWKGKKGVHKCKNRPSKAKAEKCAAKLRHKGAENVEVMAGRCGAM
jgi:hypothetical protein